jgi:putative transposase
MSSLEDIIDSSENLEVKRALAVKVIILGFKTEDICALLNVSDSFVSKWKIIYENEGADALKLNYKGGTGFLTEDQRYEIICYLRNKTIVAWKN